MKPFCFSFRLRFFLASTEREKEEGAEGEGRGQPGQHEGPLEVHLQGAGLEVSQDGQRTAPRVDVALAGQRSEGLPIERGVAGGEAVELGLLCAVQVGGDGGRGHHKQHSKQFSLIMV